MFAHLGANSIGPPQEGSDKCARNPEGGSSEVWPGSASKGPYLDEHKHNRHYLTLLSRLLASNDAGTQIHILERPKVNSSTQSHGGATSDFVVG